MDLEKIGKFIAALRKEHSLTQKELAQKLGVSDKTVSKWETGRGLPEISILKSLCEALNVTMNELLSGEKLDVTSYREKAEENLSDLMTRKSHKKELAHVITSTILFLVAFLTFPLAAEQLIPSICIPIVLFWSILLIVGNFIAGITYGMAAKWRKLKIFCIVAYNIFLLYILITTFTIAAIVFSTTPV